MFKDRLKELRIEKGITQAELARAIGTSAATIGNYEQGIREPRNNAILGRISSYFGVSIDYLIGKSNEKPSVSPAQVTSFYSPNSECPYRTDIPIIYNGIDITKLVLQSTGTEITTTEKERWAFVEFSSRSGHAIYARRNLLDILDDVKRSLSFTHAELNNISKQIERRVIYWYKRCWDDIDDLFPTVTDLSSLYDVLNKCLCVDLIATQEFCLKEIVEDFSWMRTKLNPE